MIRDAERTGSLPMYGKNTDKSELTTRSLRVDTLVKLRWLAVAGQGIALVVVYFGFGFDLPLATGLGLVAVSATINLALRAKLQPGDRLEGTAATVLLALDVMLLASLLFLTGGLANPFALLLLAPVTVSAATLSPRSTVSLAVLVAVLATLLAPFHLPLPWNTIDPPVLPPIYLAGIWVAILSTLVFSSTYAFRVAEEARQLAEALAAAELVLQREQHLNALDGLAAAAAHELGTPLGTIAVVARELEREISPDSPLAEDIALIRSQSDRCRDILLKLTTLTNDFDSYFARLPLSSLIEEVVSPFRGLGVEIVVREVFPNDADGEPVGARNPGIHYGLGNIVENAVDFARSRVDITVEWNDRTVTIIVTDDGPGFAPEVIDRIGEPYVTTRQKRSEGSALAADALGGRAVGGGLGLGFFIAKTLLKRSGATVEFANRRGPDGGAVVKIAWPRAALHGTGTPQQLSAASQRIPSEI